jgi:hypothetical protein
VSRTKRSEYRTNDKVKDIRKMNKGGERKRSNMQIEKHLQEEFELKRELETVDVG